MSFAKRLIYILSFLLVLLPFQNCGRQFQQGSFFSLNEKASDSGNGGGYEGKPDGTYYRFSPSYTCEGSPAAEEITEIKNGQAYLYVNKDNQCGSRGELVPAGDINTSPFQKEFISVKDSLFKRYEEKPDGIPNNIAEILCRDDYDHPSFEIISHYDREKNEAYTRAYTGDQQIADFPVSRILSSNEVRYVANNISFKVDLSKPAFSERKFAGQLENTTIAGMQTHSLVCVIGGSLDTSKWALKALTNRDAGRFELMNNNEILFFSEVSKIDFGRGVFQTVSHLFKIGIDNLVSDFTKAVFGDQYDIVGSGGRVGGVLSMYIAKKTGEKWTSRFFYDPRTGKTKRLTNINPEALPEQYESHSPVLTNGQLLFYDTQILNPDMSRTLVVRVYSFIDDSIHDITTLDESGNGYLVLPKTNSVAVYRLAKGNNQNVLEIYDKNAKIVSSVILKLPVNCRVYRMEAGVGDETKLLATHVCDNRTLGTSIVSVLDGEVKTLSSEGRVTWSSADGQRALISSPTKPNFAYDFRTGESIQVPVDPEFGANGLSSGLTDFQLMWKSPKVALEYDRWLYGFGGDVNAPTMYQTDLASGATRSVCNSTIGKKLYVGKLPNEKIFLMSYDESLKVYQFYQVKGADECPRINEFPSQHGSIPHLVTTNIGFGLILGDPITREVNNTAVEAVFVPVDGRPPLKFNPGSVGSWQIDVAADKKRIVLRGPDVDNVIKIFSFELN